MHMTKHVYGVYSTRPADLQPPDEAGCQQRVDAANPARTITDEHDGDATVVAYSVAHGREGGPEWGLLVCDLADVSRSYAKLLDPEALAEAEERELVGRSVRLTPTTVAGPMGEVRANVATVVD
jgi:acetyl-CoA C-acetyltransferase